MARCLEWGPPRISLGSSIIPDKLYHISIWALLTGFSNSLMTPRYSAKLLTRPCIDTLQEDLTKLYNWSQEWQMDFNVEKCKVMQIGRSNPEYQYLMNSHVLQEVKQEKDLGIMITSDLKSFSQVTEAYKKANRALGVISRSIQYKKTLLSQGNRAMPQLFFSV